MNVKIPEPFCTLTRYTLSYFGASLVFFLKCRRSSSDEPYMTENVIQPSYDPRVQNENSKPYNIAHLQDMSIQILEYYFAMTIDTDGVPVTRNCLDGRTGLTQITRTYIRQCCDNNTFFIKIIHV